MSLPTSRSNSKSHNSRYEFSQYLSLILATKLVGETSMPLLDQPTKDPKLQNLIYKLERISISGEQNAHTKSFEDSATSSLKYFVILIRA